jgi:isopropylmalate/homocitrate/citramalate synthase
MAVAACLVTLETWLALEDFKNAEWIRRQWVKIFIKHSGNEFREVRKMGRRGKMRPATDVVESARAIKREVTSHRFQ